MCPPTSRIAREASSYVHHPVRSTLDAEATDTHPDAASMRDTHLHPGMVALPTHSNETRPTSTPHVSDAHQRGLDAGAASAEPKDASASTGVVGALSALHAKLEDGAEAIKEKVDDWAEAHLRSSPKPGQHLSEAHPHDIPTLAHHENEKNNDMVLSAAAPVQRPSGSSLGRGQFSLRRSCGVGRAGQRWVMAAGVRAIAIVVGQ